jgi:hypothetical protein
MTDSEPMSLQEDLNSFQKEKEKIRDVVGRIGGARSAKYDKIANIVFIIAIIILFSLDLVRHIFEIHVPLPPLFSLEIGILLVSIKIIWMIYKQMKVEHFQFWILNSIEFRLNDLSKQIRQIQEKLK